MADLPRHVAIVMDGNGRWASRRFLPRIVGHRKGVDALRDCVRHSASRGIGALTVFAFSSENWARPVDEVSGLMELLGQALLREVPALLEQGVRLRFIGERGGLKPELASGLQAAEEATADNRGMCLNVCFNYGGRWDIVQAASALAAEGRPITEASLAARTALAHVGDPDLLIRTGGEHRLSNFLLWQSAYAELFFSDVLWPDFGAQHLDEALGAYARRQRRFGLTPEQTVPVQASDRQVA